MAWHHNVGNQSCLLSCPQGGPRDRDASCVLSQPRSPSPLQPFGKNLTLAILLPGAFRGGSNLTQLLYSFSTSAKHGRSLRLQQQRKGPLDANVSCVGEDGAFGGCHGSGERGTMVPLPLFTRMD